MQVDAWPSWSAPWCRRLQRNCPADAGVSGANDCMALHGWCGHALCHHIVTKHGCSQSWCVARRVPEPLEPGNPHGISNSRCCYRAWQTRKPTEAGDCAQLQPKTHQRNKEVRTGFDPCGPTKGSPSHLTLLEWRDRLRTTPPHGLHHMCCGTLWGVHHNKACRIDHSAPLWTRTQLHHITKLGCTVPCPCRSSAPSRSTVCTITAASC